MKKEENFTTQSIEITHYNIENIQVTDHNVEN